jgi:hypothetical protein
MIIICEPHRMTFRRFYFTEPAAYLLSLGIDSQAELQGEFKEGTTASPDPRALSED